MKKVQIRDNILTKFACVKVHTQIIEELIDAMYNSFDCKTISGIDFPIDFDFQNLFLNKSKVKAKFKILQNANKKRPKIKITHLINNDFWLSDIPSEILKNSYFLKYETIEEIESVYPDL